MKARCWKP